KSDDDEISSLGFYSKAQILEQNLHQKRPISVYCKKDSDHWSETGRSGVLCRRDLMYLIMNHVEWKFHALIKKSHCYSACNQFNIQAFEQELQFAQKITEHIVIEGDCNAHHPAWLDQNTDDVGESILDFIVSNGLHIINALPFNYTFMKDNATSSIDITLCVSSILPLLAIGGQMLNLIISQLRPISKPRETLTIGCNLLILPTRYVLFQHWVNKETNSVARSDSDKAYLLAKTFAEPSQPPKDVDEKHYEMVEDEIKFKVAISKPLELDDNYVCSFDIHQSDITREEVIEALKIWMEFPLGPINGRCCLQLIRRNASHSISQLLPLEWRQKQEEVKLYQMVRSIQWP
ncbi:hypothetical protein RFI_00379, partial [Reticulomyxa filosa]